MSLTKFFTFSFLIFLVFSVSGCTIDTVQKDFQKNLEWLDQKLGDVSEEKEKESSDITDSSVSDSTPEASDLSQEEKERIDDWLEEQGLNRYGDSKGVLYPGGSPLYNEETGEGIDRFDYILDRYPDILERINKSGR